jgi:hypothetical protein
VFEAALDHSEQQGGEVSSGTRRDSGGSSTRVNSGSSTRRSSGGGLNGRLSSLAASSGGRDDFGDEQPLAALFCVFDGHCGRLAAEQAAQLLPRELADRIDPRQLLQVRPNTFFALCTPQRQHHRARLPHGMGSVPSIPQACILDVQHQPVHLQHVRVHQSEIRMADQDCDLA